MLTRTATKTGKRRQGAGGSVSGAPRWFPGPGLPGLSGGSPGQGPRWGRRSGPSR
ncbi:hypothetical protein SSCG_02364 [Streptomyces clavuligerus]|nr:hypothetical protein SSCG_02364 [Streptomyces clavuligerus]